MQRNMARCRCYTRRHAFPKRSTCENPALVARLNEAADNAGRTARRLAENLGRERDQMQTLGLHLDTQATGVIDAVERQSRMVADASDLAQAQLREAEAALAARAAGRLAARSGRYS